MSRQFSAYPVVPPIGAPFSQPLTLEQRSTVQPLQVPFYINWSLYNNNGTIPNIGIQLNLGQGLSGLAVMDRIVYVFIDNSGSNVPVYVYFPDTGYTVACAPGAQIGEPVITGSVSPVVYGIGFTGGVQPYTNVFFANRQLQQSLGSDTNFVIPQYYASSYNPAIANNTPYRALALGDQTLQASVPVFGNFPTTSGAAPTLSPIYLAPPLTGAPINATAYGNSTNLAFPLTGANQYIYITGFSMWLAGVSVQQAATAALTVNWRANIFLKDTTGILNFSVPFVAQQVWGTAVTPGLYNLVPVISLTGLQLKIPAVSSFSFGSDAALGCGNASSGIYGTNAGYFKYGGNTYSANNNLGLYLTVNYTARDESQSPI